MIPFNKPLFLGKEMDYMHKAAAINRRISGDGFYSQACGDWLSDQAKVKKALLTTSCTHALEMTALLCKIKEGDEVIMPSYTFVSTANAFVLRGAKIVFVDIRPDTMNIDENLIEAAITEKTRVIVPVHYGGVACEMDKIMAIAKKHHLVVVEDAAQGLMASYRGRPLGGIGHLATYSFHESKNYSMGEGGALVIGDPDFIERAKIIREKGTDRSQFLAGQRDKYSWVDLGSSYLPSELNAAYLYAQLEEAQAIKNKRKSRWDDYFKLLKPLEDRGKISRPQIPPECDHNGHMFYIKVKDFAQRQELIAYLKGQGILSVFHYIPLHSAKAGLKFGRFNGTDRYTTKESDRLLRLPLFYDLSQDQVLKIVGKIEAFYQK